MRDERSEKCTVPLQVVRAPLKHAQTRTQCLGRRVSRLDSALTQGPPNELKEIARAHEESCVGCAGCVGRVRGVQQWEAAM